MPIDPAARSHPHATLGPDDLRWLRALARRLARSSDEADDLVQETWLAAEQATGTPPRSRRAWLLGVLRNRERMQRRSEARRRRREAHAQPGGGASEAELELHRQRVLSTVREALDELDEGDRALLVARYCDERLAPELAERLGLPASTVRSRLSRATARVRRSLDERWGGDRRAWAPAVLAMPVPTRVVGSATAGPKRIVMNAVGMKTAIAFVLVAVVGALGWWLGPGRASDSEGQAANAAASEAEGSRADDERAALLARKRAEHEQSPLDRAPASLGGRVLAADTGQPVAGALVLVTRHLPHAPAITPRLLTGADGRFALEGLPAGRYSITAAALGHLPARHELLELRPGAAEDAVELRLATGGNVVEGMVTDIGGGPVEGALVQAYPPGGFEPSDERVAFGTLTDAEGHYALTLADGTWMVEAGGDDYTAERRSVHVVKGPGRADFELVPGAEIHGQVVDRASGQPIAGAVVGFSREVRRGTIRSRNTADLHETTITDAEGRFVLRPLQPAEYALLAAAPGLATGAAVRVHAAIGEEVTGVVLPVDPAFEASGFVVDRADPAVGVAGGVARGLGGIRVSVMSPDDDLRRFAITEPDGHFALHGLLPGSHVLMFEGQGVIPSGLEHRLTIEDADRHDAIFELERGLSVEGRVQPPVAGTVSVRGRQESGGLEIMMQSMKLQNARATVAEDGTFTIDGVPPGEWKVVAVGEDGSRGELEITVGEASLQGVKVSLAPRSRVAGVVLDGEGRPVAGLTVRLQSAADPSIPASLRRPKVVGEAVTARDGAFVMRGVDPGRHGLGVWDARDQPVAVRSDGAEPYTVEAIAGRDVTELELRVELPHGRIEGTVTGPDGEPVEDAWVVATPQPTDDPMARGSHFTRRATTLTDADGRFAFEGLADRRYDLHARGSQADTRGVAEGVDPGATVAISLEALGMLEGVVTQGGAPVTRFGLDAGALGGEYPVISTDGTFTVARVEPGPLRVTVTTDTGAASAQVDVAPGAVARVELELGPWGSVSGVAVTPDGQPLAGVELSVDAEGGMRKAKTRALDWFVGGGSPKTDDQGRFSVEGIGAGPCRISFRQSDRRMPMGVAAGSQATHELVLDPGQALDLGTIVVELPQPEPPRP